MKEITARMIEHIFTVSIFKSVIDLKLEYVTIARIDEKKIIWTIENPMFLVFHK